MRAQRTRWTVVCIALAVSACATRYVERPPGQGYADELIGDVVVSAATADFANAPPVCLGVMPFSAGSQVASSVDDIRQAFHAHLAPTGIKLVSLQKIDQLVVGEESPASRLAAVASATGCDTLVTGEVTERKTRFWGVYSEVRAGARVKIVRVSTGEVIWDGRHTAVMRDGGLPLNPISLVGGAVSAGANLRDEQVRRTVHDLARRLVHAIPNLRYIDDVPPAAPALVATDGPGAPSSVHAFLASLESQPRQAQQTALLAALDGADWPAPRDRLTIAESLIRLDAGQARGYAEAAGARLALAEPLPALELAKKAVQRDAQQPEHQFLLARAYLQLNQAELAIRPLLKSVGAAQPRALHYAALGLAYNQTGRHTLAAAALNRALAIEPDNAFSLLQLGIAEAGAGNEAEAAKVLRKSMILSIVAEDAAAARRALNLFKALNLNTQLTEEELRALEARIDSLPSGRS